MINLFKKSAVFILFYYLPLQSMAWGVLGHRIVGQIADFYLTPSAKIAIYKILGNESIAMASNYADFIKSDSNYNYVSPWHYVNIVAGLSKEEVKNFLKNDTSVDAFTKINFLVKELKNKRTPDEIKLFDLKLLIHIVGDIHQPLHTGRLADLGGNKVKVSWFNTPSNLHRVWDEQLINFQLLSYTEYVAAINHITMAERKNWFNQDIQSWIYDSYQLAEKIYADKKTDDKLGYEYNYIYVSSLNQQLLKGGLHLAGLLNQIFGNKN